MAFTKEQEQFIRDNCDTMTNGQMAQALGKTLDTVRKFRYTKKIKCQDRRWYMSTPEYLEKQSKAHKDNIPNPRLPEFTIRDRKDDRPEIKVGKKWVRLNRYVWEKHHGPIPDGHIVQCLGNKFSLDPKDYKLVSNKDHLNNQRKTKKFKENRRIGILEAYETERIRLRYGLKPRIKKNVNPW